MPRGLLMAIPPISVPKPGETITGDFSLDGIECFVQMEIPMEKIHQINYPPRSREYIVQGVVKSMATRIVMLTGGVFWSKGDREWWKYRNTHEPTFSVTVNEKKWSICVERGHHNIDAINRVCSDCGMTAVEILKDGPLSNQKRAGGIVHKGFDSYNTNNELGRKLAEADEQRYYGGRGY